MASPGVRRADFLMALAYATDLATGQSRFLDFLHGCRGVQLRDGNVVVDSETGRTTNPRYYAGGDCVNGGREVVDAVADGKRAALGMVNHGVNHG